MQTIEVANVNIYPPCWARVFQQMKRKANCGKNGALFAKLLN